MENNLISEIVRNTYERAKAGNIGSDNDYKGADGLLYCGICQEPKEAYLEERHRKFIPSGIVPIMCRCARERQAEENKLDEQLRAWGLANKLREQGLTNPEYYHYTFSADNGSAPEAIAAARWYSDNFEELRKQKKGMLFMGSMGTGKTFAACCIANALIDKGITAWVTTLFPLLQAVRDFKTSLYTLERIRNVDLLVLDDFGTAQGGTGETELLYQIINTRYLSGKPLVITTNLTPADIKNAPLEFSRIYDRLREMCMCEKSPVKLTGKSLRVQAAKDKQKG